MEEGKKVVLAIETKATLNLSRDFMSLKDSLDKAPINDIVVGIFFLNIK